MLKRIVAGLPWLCLYCAVASDPTVSGLAIPTLGEHSLQILTPTVLELYRVNTKQPDPARADSWDWVDSDKNFVPPDTSSLKVVINGQTNDVIGIGFKRRAAYAPLLYWDLRIANQLYLLLSEPVPDGASVEVINDGTLWPTTMQFSAIADPLRFNPAIHVNQEGYLPSYPKIAIVGYSLGSLGEMALATDQFFIVDAETGTPVYQGTLALRTDIGYLYNPTPYQNVYEADFSGFTIPGAYRLAVPGMGASVPFRINEGVAMNFARTYALGAFHQRRSFNVAMPFTRFTHAADHLGPANVPTDESGPFTSTWSTISNYAVQVNPDNPPQTAPWLTDPTQQLYPFINQPLVSVSGGHFDAGDYHRNSYNAAQIIHTLLFAVDSLPGVGVLDNLGIPESGDGISDLLQEAKWEADALVKMQDADGAFYYSLHPLNREYELDVLPENGDPQVVWPKNTACTAAAVAALAQCASSLRFKQAYPQAASNYWETAKRGWQFLTNALAEHGLSGAYQKLQHFGDTFTDRDDLAWAACELFLASGETHYQDKLFEWFPDPADPATFRYGWHRMFACFGNVVRDYAFAVSSGRLAMGQLSASYLGKCITTITNCGNDQLYWSQNNAYGASFPVISKAYRGGWYFSPEQALDLLVAYQFNANPQYLDAFLRNLNFEAGCNPVNAMYLTGLGWNRQRNVVDQYSLNDRRSLPKSGVPISSIQTGFFAVWTYGWELGGLSYPPDYSDIAPYPYYDRRCDDWNVSTEGSTTDIVRGLAGLAWLAAQTTLAGQPWCWTNATIVAPAFPRPPGVPLTVTLEVADTNLSEARIVWEAFGQEPVFGGQAYTFTPTNGPGSYWLEAEVQWPDGRRAFATNAVIISADAPPYLTNPRKIASGFSFTLTGTPFATYITKASSNLRTWTSVATNTLPVNGIASVTDTQAPSSSRRYYRVVKAP